MRLTVLATNGMVSRGHRSHVATKRFSGCGTDRGSFFFFGGEGRVRFAWDELSAECSADSMAIVVRIFTGMYYCINNFGQPQMFFFKGLSTNDHQAIHAWRLMITVVECQVEDLQIPASTSIQYQARPRPRTPRVCL